MQFVDLFRGLSVSFIQPLFTTIGVDTAKKERWKLVVRKLGEWAGATRAAETAPPSTEQWVLLRPLLAVVPELSCTVLAVAARRGQ